MTRQQDPGDRFAALARELRGQVGESDTTDRALELSVETITGCDEVAVSLIRRRGRIETINATGDRARQADQWQYELGGGPCLETIRDRETTLVRDLGRDERWPRWSRKVQAELGFGSVLCLRLFTTSTEYGVMNLYSESVDGFDEHDQTVGLALAAHVAVAVASSRQIENLTRSQHSREVIGRAVGIVQERYDLDGRRAFEFLQRISSTTNTRLIAIAEHLATTGQLPGATAPPTD